jgi:hypothetical protein
MSFLCRKGDSWALAVKPPSGGRSGGLPGKVVSMCSMIGVSGSRTRAQTGSQDRISTGLSH